MADKHEKTEIAIFKAFAKSCDLTIKPESIRKMAPPKPDIQCEASGIGMISFELVRIIDRNFANLLEKQYDTKKGFSEYYSNLPQDQRDLFDELYPNAMIFPQFENKSTLRQRQKIFPKMFNYLLSLEPEAEGETCKNHPEFKNILEGISISRGRFRGPLFDLPFGGAIGDPTISIIRGKFQKTYESDYPLHLLAYIDLTPRFPDEIWLNALEGFIQAPLKSSQFEKVWIFDYEKNTIKFEYSLTSS